MALHQMKIKYQPKYVDTHRGKQFSHAFLALNPKGEVPVLVDDVRVIPDAEKIIDYLQDNFANGMYVYISPSTALPYLALL